MDVEDLDLERFLIEAKDCGFFHTFHRMNGNAEYSRWWEVRYQDYLKAVPADWIESAEEANGEGSSSAVRALSLDQDEYHNDVVTGKRHAEDIREAAPRRSWWKRLLVPRRRNVKHGKKSYVPEEW